MFLFFKVTTETIPRSHYQYVSKPVRDVKVWMHGVGGELVDQTTDSPYNGLCHHMRAKCAQ
jgi:hypothetical protein